MGIEHRNGLPDALPIDQQRQDIQGSEHFKQHLQRVLAEQLLPQDAASAEGATLLEGQAQGQDLSTRDIYAAAAAPDHLGGGAQHASEWKPIPAEAPCPGISPNRGGEGLQHTASDTEGRQAEPQVDELQEPPGIQDFKISPQNRPFVPDTATNGQLEREVGVGNMPVNQARNEAVLLSRISVGPALSPLLKDATDDSSTLIRPSADAGTGTSLSKY